MQTDTDKREHIKNCRKFQKSEERYRNTHTSAERYRIHKTGQEGKESIRK